MTTSWIVRWGRIQLVLLAGLVCCVTAIAGARAAGSNNLASEHPEAAIFRQMARRGGMDYAARFGRLPASLAEIQDSGYTPYLFPTNWRPSFDFGDAEVRINSLGRPAWFGGESVRDYSVYIGLPPGGLYSDTPAPPGLGGLNGAGPGLQREWAFPGAEWLYAGMAWADVDAALRRERLALHLNWLTMEQSRGNGLMPQSLRELEELNGTERNLLGWQGTQEVFDLDSVRWQPGNLFVGWDHNAWVISINLGPKVATWRWTPRRDGTYGTDGPLGY